jgi:hypothetical protein
MRGSPWSLATRSVVRRPHIYGALAGALLGVLLTAEGGTAHAQKAPRSPANLDGLYVTIGPIGAATRVEDEWLSAAGGELSVVYVRERCLPAAVGVDAGGISFAGRAGGRIWAEAEVAIGRPLPVGIGVSAGLVAEVDANRPPRYGWQGTIWVFAGIIPYFRVGSVEESGGFVELGLMIKIPARRF